MNTNIWQNTLMELDDVDRDILTVLYGDGRASWQKVAAEIGSSVSTVRRHYESLINRGLIRIIGRTDVSKLGYGPPALLKYRGRDALSPEFHDHLKNHPHVRYLAATVGSAHCLAEVVPKSLPDLRQIISDIGDRFSVNSEAFVVTHTYTSGQDWLPGTASRIIDTQTRTDHIELSVDEQQVMSRLLENGRTSFSSLAAESSRSENTVKRIVNRLLDDDIVSLRILVEPQVLGFEAKFWTLLEVEPSKVPEAAKILANNPATKTLWATAGNRNLIGQFVLPRHTDTFAFMTEVLGELPGARSVETLLESDTYKRVWNVVSGTRYQRVAGPDWLFPASGRA
ncbi:MAG: Lrp/AsnC family transcriptional regulator [Canibacter sp.]